jgi:hypothetical protein
MQNNSVLWIRIGSDVDPVFLPQCGSEIRKKLNLYMKNILM